MSNRRGYALFLAVMVVVGLALALLTVARIQADLAPEARRTVATMRAAIAAESAYAQLSFVLLTVAPGGRSLSLENGELAFDGRYYRVGEGIAVSVQDEAGLINLNSSDENAIAGALQQAGVNARRSERLAAALLDYVDEDDLVRTNGAERADYSSVDEVQNSPITRRWDALSALGWRAELLPEQRETIWALTTASSWQGGINVNTAPPLVLQSILGGGRAAQALLDARSQRELRDLGEVAALTVNSLRASGAGLAVTPADAFRLTVIVEEARSSRRFERRIELGEAVADAPLRWRDERREQGGANRVEQRDLQSLPGPWRDAGL